MSKGYVYILSNEAMPGLLKIGRTTGDVQARAQQLYQTGVPLPFKVEAEFLSPDCEALEAHTHGLLSTFRVSSSREFFNCDLGQAKSAISDYVREQVEDLVGEYFPDEILVEADMFIDPSAMCLLAAIYDLHPYAMADAINELRNGDESLEAGIARDRERKAERLKERAAEKESQAPVKMSDVPEVLQ